MSKQVQLRRGTTVEHSTFTGAVGEVTIDTTKDTVVVHDGSTAGGHPLSRLPSSEVLTGYTIAGTGALPAATDTVNEAFGKLAKQLTPVGLLKSNGTVVSAASAGTDYLTPSDIIDTLVSTSTTDALSANQGKILQDGKVNKSTFDANSILYATTDNTPVALVVAEQTVVGRATGGNIAALAIDSDLSSVSENDDTIPSAKATKAMSDRIDGHSLSEMQAVFGAIWAKGSSPACTRTGYMVGATVAAGVDTTPGSVQTVTISGTEVLTYNHYMAQTALFDWPEVEDTYGNIFVKIPKIYLKKVNGTTLERYASRTSFEGSYLPKCFWDFTNSRELDYILVGKYKAGLSDDTTKMDSKPDKFPLVSKNIVQMRAYAEANNTGGLSGYQQLDIHTVDLLQTLFIIQTASQYSQSFATGYIGGRYTTDAATVTESDVNRIIVANATAAYYAVGQTIGIGTTTGGNNIASNRVITSIDVYDGSNQAISFDGDPVTVTTGNYVYNLAYKNGFSDDISSKFGSKVSNSTGKHPFVWQGIESLYGDVYQFVDGVNINEHQAWVCEDADNYVSNVFASPYVQLSYTNATSNNYISELGYDSNYPYAQFPTAVVGNNNTYYTDYYIQNTGQRIALFGGYWNDGSGAGLFFWVMGSSSSVASVYFGARLLKKPLP